MMRAGARRRLSVGTVLIVLALFAAGNQATWALAQPAVPPDVIALLPGGSTVVSAVTADLTGTGATDWAVLYTTPTGSGFGSDAHLAIVVPAATGWTVAFTTTALAANLASIHQIAVGALPAVAFQRYVGAHAAELTVYRWDGNGFAAVFDGGSDTPSISAEDVDGDGTAEVIDYWSPYCNNYVDSPQVLDIYEWDGTRYSEWLGPYPDGLTAPILSDINRVLANSSDWPASARACLYGALGYQLTRAGDASGGGGACDQAQRVDAAWEEPSLCPGAIIAPADKVALFYELLDQQDFITAWDELSDGFRAQRTYESWKAGYATTHGVTVEYTTEVNTDPEVVQFSILATDDLSGQLVTRRFAGTWTLVFEDRVWKLDLASVQLAQ